MKNATRLHENTIVDFLHREGCTSIRLDNGSIAARRPGRDGRLYPLSIDIYEDDSRDANSAMRFRARVARCFGLPVTSHHGDSVESALAAVQWGPLDRFAIASAPTVLAGDY